jgi:hypothetical protein
MRTSALRWRLQIQVAIHGRATHAHQLGDVELGEPGGIERADLLVLLDLPACSR